MSEFQLDLHELNVRARIPSNSVIDGEAQYNCGLLLEGTLRGKAKINGPLVLLSTAVLAGEAEIEGDAYILGKLHAERVIIKGTAHFADGSTINGCVHAGNYQSYAGAEVTASLLKLP